jgi:osmotically inducible protein OsmC
MALSHGLATGGHPPTHLDTDAVATLEQLDVGWRLTKIALSVRGDVPGITAESFQEAANEAKEGCPVSNALAGNVEISLTATLL